MTTVSEKLESAKKFVRSIVMPAAVAVATVTTGCVSVEGGRPKYMGYLNPNDKDFATQKAAYENQGMAVEATFITGEDGKSVAVWGVREKTFIERTNDHLNQNEGIYRNVDRIVTTGLRLTDTIYGIKTEGDLKKISKEEKKQTRAAQKQNILLENAIKNLSKSNGGCGN